MPDRGESLATDGLELARAMTCRGDAAGRVVAAAGATGSLLGVRAEALPGHRLVDLVQGSAGRALSEVLAGLDRAGEPAELEIALGANGEAPLTRWRIRREADAGFLAFAADVTSERKRLTAFRRVVDALPVMIAYVDREKRYRFNNGAHCRQFGLSSAELYGRPVREVMGPRAYALIEADIERALNGEPVRHERALSLQDGRHLDTRAEFLPDIASDGSVSGFYLVAQDVTEYRSTLDLMRAAHRVTSRQDVSVDEMIQELLELGALHFNLPIGSVASLAGDSLRLEYVTPADRALPPGRVYALASSCARRVIEGDEVVHFHAGPPDTPCRQPGHGDTPPAAYLGVPLFVRGRLYGVIAYSSDGVRETPFDEIDCELVRLLAGAVSGLIARAQYEAQLHAANQRLLIEASTDPLTGLFSRRFIDEILGREVEIANRHHRDLAVAMIDLDHFKAVNDTHGHEAGDRVLQAVSRELTRELRQSDVIARFGGEEFIVMLPETSLAVATHACERLRERVARLTVEVTPDAPVRVTASVGIAAFVNGDDTRTLLRRADRALYEAKSHGRNRVETG